MPALLRSILTILLALSFAGLVRGDEDNEKERLVKLIKQLKSEKVVERQLAASELAKLGPDAKTAIKNIVEAMQKDSNAKVRAYCVFALKQMGDGAREQIPEITDVLKTDKNEEVRCVAADTLARFGK